MHKRKDGNSFRRIEKHRYIGVDIDNQIALVHYRIEGFQL